MSEPVTKRKRGAWRDRIDLAVGLLALITSAVSIWLSVTQGDDMGRLVQAQSWPHVELQSSNFSDDGEAEIVLGLRNGGVGPAKLVSFQVIVDGVPVQNSNDMLRRCCASTPGALDAPGELARARGTIITAGTRGTVLRPGDLRPFFQLKRTETNQALWQKLDRARFELRFELCYCSVFDECWLSPLDGLTVAPVASCPAVAVPYNE